MADLQNCVHTLLGGKKKKKDQSKQKRNSISGRKISHNIEQKNFIIYLWEEAQKQSFIEDLYVRYY